MKCVNLIEIANNANLLPFFYEFFIYFQGKWPSMSDVVNRVLGMERCEKLVKVFYIAAVATFVSLGLACFTHTYARELFKVAMLAFTVSSGTFLASGLVIGTID